MGGMLACGVAYIPNLDNVSGDGSSVFANNLGQVGPGSGNSSLGFSPTYDLNSGAPGFGGPDPGQVSCQQNLAQTTIDNDIGRLGLNVQGFKQSMQLVGVGGASQAELILTPTDSNAVNNLACSMGISAAQDCSGAGTGPSGAFLNGGSDLLHPGMLSTWREGTNNLSMQVTFMRNGSVQIDIDPNNPMFNFLGHAGDVAWDWLASTDTNYGAVANAFGFSVTPCR